MLTYRMMVLIGLLAHTGDKGAGVQTLQKKLRLKSVVSIYHILLILQRNKMAEKVFQARRAALRGRPRCNYKLTKKGKRYAKKYNLGVLADNPAYIPLQKFK